MVARGRRYAATNTPTGAVLFTLSRGVGIYRLELYSFGLQPNAYPYMLYPHGTDKAPRQVCVP